MADDFGSNFDLGGYEDLAPGGTDYYDFGQGDVPYQSTNIYGSPDTSSFFGNIGSALKNLFGGTGPGGDAAKFGAFLGLAGLANRSNFFNAPPTKVGYQGGIPQYTATRTQLPLPYSSTDQARLNQAVQNSLAQGFSLADTKLGAERRFGISPAEIDAALAANPPPYRRPGAGGITYFSPMQYSQAGEPASVAPTTPTTPVTPEPTTPSLTPSTEPQGAKKGILSARTGTTTGGAAAEEAASAPVAPEALSKLTPSQRLLFNQLSGKPGQGSDQTLLNYVSGLSDYQSLASLAASRGETGDLKNWGSERGYELAEELANKYGVSGTMTMGSGVTVPIKGTTTGAGTTPGGTTGTTTGGTTGGIGGLPGALKVDSAMKAYLEAQKQGDRHALSILARSGLSDAEITKAFNAATGRNLTEEQVRKSLDIYQSGGALETQKLGTVIDKPTTEPSGGIASLSKINDVISAYKDAVAKGDRHAAAILARSGLSDADITKAFNAATGRNLTEGQVRTSLDIYQPGGVYENVKLGQVIDKPTASPSGGITTLPKTQNPNNPTAPTQEAPYGYVRIGKGAGYRPITAQENASLSASLAANKAASEAREKFKRETGYYEDDPYYQAMQSFISKYGVSPQQASQMTPEQRVRLVNNTVGDFDVFSRDFGIFGVPKQGTIPVSTSGLEGNEKFFDQLLNERFGPSSAPTMSKPMSLPKYPSPGGLISSGPSGNVYWPNPAPEPSSPNLIGYEDPFSWTNFGQARSANPPVTTPTTTVSNEFSPGGRWYNSGLSATDIAGILRGDWQPPGTTVNRLESTGIGPSFRGQDQISDQELIDYNARYGGYGGGAAAGGYMPRGIATLAKGRYLRGNGDGVSDSIPARFAQSGQPAALADGEFVIPARVVSELGNGSSDAGARKLYAMLDRVEQRARKAKRGKPSGADRELNKLA